MKQTLLFPKTKKLAPKDAQSINHKLLVQAGFIDQLMAGSWTLLPLGLRVVAKINDVIREELNAIGAQEVLMPLLHPKEVWNETGRWDSASEIMYKLTDTREKEFALSFTHEEIFLDLVRKHIDSYKDLPIALYHFSTKFRNELRARSGILRGREFMMKDLYSLHGSEGELEDYYEKVKDAYSKVFTRLGFKFVITEAGGGVFTENRTHEFQVISDGGEDTIYYCEECGWGENSEVFENKVGVACPVCGKGEIKEATSIEVGNIFKFGTYYSEKMNIVFTDEKGRQANPYFASYGIGSTRVMGTWVEVSHDERGIIWNKQLAPFDVHLLDLPGAKNTEEVYEKLTKAGVEVLWDERDLSAGQKFADSDLIGIPVRVVVSEKTEDKLEYKERASEKTELLEFEDLVQKLQVNL